MTVNNLWLKSKPTNAGFSKRLKKKLVFMLSGAEVAQFGRALDSTIFVVEGEAEDRVVAGSSPALGTTTLSFRKESVLRKLEFRLVSKVIPRKMSRYLSRTMDFSISRVKTAVLSLVLGVFLIFILATFIQKRIHGFICWSLLQIKLL